MLHMWHRKAVPCTATTARCSFALVSLGLVAAPSTCLKKALAGPVRMLNREMTNGTTLVIVPLYCWSVLGLLVALLNAWLWESSVEVPAPADGTYPDICGMAAHGVFWVHTHTHTHHNAQHQRCLCTNSDLLVVVLCAVHTAGLVQLVVDPHMSEAECHEAFSLLFLTYLLLGLGPELKWPFLLGMLLCWVCVSCALSFFPLSSVTGWCGLTSMILRLMHER